MNKPVILALDIGSSSRRGQLVDRKFRFLVDKTPRRHNVIDCRSDGSATLDANELTEDVMSLLDQLTKIASDLPVRIIGVAISCIWHSVVGAEIGSSMPTRLHSMGPMGHSPGPDARRSPRSGARSACDRGRGDALRRAGREDSQGKA